MTDTLEEFDFTKKTRAELGMHEEGGIAMADIVNLEREIGYREDVRIFTIASDLGHMIKEKYGVWIHDTGAELLNIAEIIAAGGYEAYDAKQEQRKQKLIDRLKAAG